MLLNLLLTIRYGPSLRSGPNVQNITNKYTQVLKMIPLMNNSGNPLIQINCWSFSFLQSNGNGPETEVNFLALTKNGPEDCLVVDNFREFLPPNEVDLQRVIEKKSDRIGRKMRTFHQCM